MAKKDRKKDSEKSTPGEPTSEKKKLDRKTYETALFDLQAELVKLQEWVVARGERIIIVFEGRDAAGKGGVIKRITERVSSRIFRVVALPAPTEREKSQIYMQRYIANFPAAGEIVLFDRSWYNRAGVERVMNFCSEEEYRRFLHSCPMFEKGLVDDGIRLFKYWFDIGRRGAATAHAGPHHGPQKDLETEPDGSQIATPLVRLFTRPGRHVLCHRYTLFPLVRRGGGRQAARSAQLHYPPVESNTLRGATPRGSSSA